MQGRPRKGVPLEVCDPKTGRQVTGIIPRGESKPDFEMTPPEPGIENVSDPLPATVKLAAPRRSSGCRS